MSHWQHRAAHLVHTLASSWMKSLDRKRQAIPCRQNFQRLSWENQAAHGLSKRCGFLSMVHSLFVVSRFTKGEIKERFFFIKNIYLLPNDVESPKASELNSSMVIFIFSNGKPDCQSGMHIYSKNYEQLEPYAVPSKFLDANTVASYLLPMYEFYFGDSLWFMICPILRRQQGYWPRTLYDFPQKIWTFHLDLRLSFEFDLHFCWKTIALKLT